MYPPHSNPRRVLFLCTGNSARSQMAEAFLRQYSGWYFDVFSGGFEPRGIHPYTIAIMREIGIDVSQQQSKSLSLYLGKVHFSYLITVCSQAEARCPTFPGMGQRLYWPFEDPVAFDGSAEEKIVKFRQTRNLIDKKIREWLKEQGKFVREIEPPIIL